MDETQALLAVEPMVCKICTRFSWIFWLDREELTQEMRMLALKAIRKHDPERGPLTAYVRKSIINSLYRRVNHRKFHERFCKKPPGEVPEVPSQSDFDIGVFLMEISEDAALACCVALRENVEDRNYIESILHSSHGWAQSKIDRVFKEIQDALS